MLHHPGLYVHLPWCVRKCPYCDFNSHEARGTPPKDVYIDALIADLAEQVRQFKPEPFATVFFGGGTPSLFSAEQLDKVLCAARELCGFTNDVEITLEANPGTLEHDSFIAYRQIGINRVSLGVQSFNDAALQRLGRIHGGDEARQAIESVRSSDMPEFNLDLMYALPGQTVAQALADIDEALSFAPAHISQYQLTIEPNTLFAVHTPVLPEMDVAIDMQDRCQSRLADAGFEHYEVSAYAQAGFQARHNINYWRFGDYLGVGAGAHGKISNASGMQRSVKPKHPTLYMQNPAATSLTQIEPREQSFEFMLNRLRLRSTLHLNELRERAIIIDENLTEKLGLACDNGLMVKITHETYDITDTGWRFLNDLQELFLP